jgi:hypothetical protein
MLLFFRHDIYELFIVASEMTETETKKKCCSNQIFDHESLLAVSLIIDEKLSGNNKGI